MENKIRDTKRQSFTLIELLVVLALVAILSVVVVMTLNPAELLKQARDSTRLSDISTLNTALGAYETDVVGGFMGTSSIVYISIPDNSSSTCGSILGLPSLPSGWSYRCATTQALRNTDGTGWIPVNFQRISFGSPLSQLPIDPQNTTSTSYYAYITGGSFKISATNLESQKYLAQASIDGGSSATSYEMGSNLSLASGFFTFCPTSVSHGGETYNTVIIGSQCWLARNLNSGTRIGWATAQTDNGVLEKYCYNDLDLNCANDGGLYSWYEAMGYSITAGAQGICPVGWHIPTDANQHALDSYLTTGTCDANRSAEDCSPAGTALSPAGSSGFGAEYPGYASGGGAGWLIGTDMWTWSSTQSSSNAIGRRIRSITSTVIRSAYTKTFGFSVRCIKN